MTTTAELHCHVACHPGLEALAERELAELGLTAVAPPGGGVDFSGGAGTLAVALMSLRTAGRVTVRMASFTARTFAELERHAASGVDWQKVLSPERPVHFRVTSKKSRLYHQDAIAERLERVAAAAVPGVQAVRAASAAEELEKDVLQPPGVQRIVVRLHRDRVSLMADAAGGVLHRRGWRQEVAKAPLRETLAAAMIIGAGWDGRATLIDPMCGSGTILIEAALLARRMSPGRQRRFAADHWPFMAGAVGNARRAAGEAELPAAPATLLGFDRDAGAVAAARRNAERAGVAEDVSFEVAPIAALAEHQGHGLIITNPPYGARIGSPGALRDLYATLGRVSAGHHLALLSADPRLAGQLGRQMRTAWSTSNGGIPVELKTSGEIGDQRSEI